MNSQTFLTIKEPCHQGWENMSISEKGKFCSSCQKHVHDFSNSGIDEIKKAYSQNKDGLCGHVPVRLLQEQYVERGIQKVHNSYLKKFCLATILCFGASLFTVDAAKASTFYKVRTAFFNFVVATDNDTIIVKGIVQAKINREKIPFVNVVALVNDSIVAYATTNIDGEYTLKISKENSKVDVKASYIGYVKKIIKGVNIALNMQIVVDFDMEEDEVMMDGEMIMIEEPSIIHQPGPTGKTIKREEYMKMPK